MRLPLLAAASLVLVWFAAPALGTDYFVSPAGDDAGAGASSDKPLKTIARAAGCARAGDTIRIAPGTYTERAALKNSGEEKGPITIRRDGNAEVVWTTPQPDPETWTQKFALDLTGRQHVVVEGITFRNCAAWILLASSEHVTIRNCVFDGGRIYNLLRLNNASYTRILDCRFLSALKQTSVRKDLGWIPDPGADYIEIYRNSHHNLVEDCEFGAITHVAVAIEPFEKGTSPAYNIVRRCVFRNPEWKPIGVLEGARHTVVEDCVCEGNAALFVHVEAEHVILRRNLFLRYRDVTDGKPDLTQRGAMRIGGGATDSRFYNNLFYDNQRTITSFNIRVKAAGNVWKNNLFFDNAQSVFLGFPDPQTRNPNLLQNNLLRGKAAGEKLIQTDKGFFTLAEAQAKFADLYRGNIEADPKLQDPAKDDFRLKEDSPCIDAGADLTTAAADGRGKTVPVEDPFYFYDGFGLVDGDAVVVGANKPARVIKADYEKKTLELDREIAWKKGDAVNLPYQGKAPDIGPRESGGK